MMRSACRHQLSALLFSCWLNLIALVSHASKQDPSSDHTGKDPSEEWKPKQKLQTDRRDSKRKGTRRNHESQTTDAQSTRAPATTLYVLVDFKKTFDSISHDKLWETMMDMGYLLHMIDFLTKLYRKQLAKVKVAQSEWFHVEKGIRQCHNLSLYLFNILSEMVMRETVDGFQGGLQTGRQIVTNLCYADDIMLLATSEAELQELVNRLDRVSRK